eukprot:3601055-Rhodomonas_salina.1
MLPKSTNPKAVRQTRKVAIASLERANDAETRRGWGGGDTSGGGEAGFHGAPTVSPPRRDRCTPPSACNRHTQQSHPARGSPPSPPRKTFGAHLTLRRGRQGQAGAGSDEGRERDGIEACSPCLYAIERKQERNKEHRNESTCGAGVGAGRHLSREKV